jgi:predicted NBD/HSP70 family sugar kinase
VYRWGIDLGGTKIEGVVLPESGEPEPLCRLRVPTESSKGYAHILGQIHNLVDEMAAVVGSSLSRVGIGTPGVIDPGTGLLKNSNTVALNGQPLRVDLAKELGCEVVTANDANCFALAETLFGAAKGAATVFGVILGTGVGGGIIIDGRVVTGLHGIAGEWGHNLLEQDGHLCYCGKRGCVETVISGPALERFYFGLSGEPLRLPEIVIRSRAGDVSALATVDRLVQNLGLALSVVVNILDPEAIVLGGGVGQIDELYSAGVESLKRFVFNDTLRTKILRPTLGDSAGVFGAALL